jgi:hypothetical protein
MLLVDASLRQKVKATRLPMIESTAAEKLKKLRYS